MNIPFSACTDKPILEDSCYAEASELGALRWSPPQSCGKITRYQMLYTQAMCDALETSMERVNLTNETSVFLPPSKVYCIKVRGVINEDLYSSYSTCAQVASLKQGTIIDG